MAKKTEEKRVGRPSLGRKAKTKCVTAKLTETLAKKLATKCKREKTTPAAFVRALIENAV